MSFGIPPGGVREDQTEWVLERATELDVPPAVVWDYVERNTEGDVVVADEDRARLTRFLDSHLARPMVSDHTRVRLYDGPEGRYDYIKGVHYAQDVEGDVRRMVHAVAADQQMTVEVDGDCGIAVRFHEPVASADAYVAAEILRRAFDEPLEAVDDIIEIVDYDTQRSWNELD
ncbi:hypothetical protein [Haloarchaeobius amylolyticus]|uniref:hypothetical protein n=1 Tax=Haloarchaeobius amylolyticus TaxID=1198296 RepID=UPI00226EB5B5|nr:hypothetical protein [Haloarchaeobius amylolyticus]